MSSPKTYDLLVVAHPDDETLFFGGLLQRRRTRPWMVVCVTDANADGQGTKRRRQFERACKLLGVKKTQWWNFPDRYAERLPVATLIERLRALPKPHTIYTHGIIGEYGHPHHQDVSYAVHHAFPNHPRVYASAYNAFPDFSIVLDRREFAKKSKVLIDVYGSETSRFLNLLTSSSSEGFLKLDEKEVDAIYAFHSKGTSLKTKSLKHYAWYAKFLKSRRAMKRLF